jgi:hypothetical protein
MSSRPVEMVGKPDEDLQAAERLRTACERIRQELGKVIVGQDSGRAGADCDPDSQPRLVSGVLVWLRHC